MFSTISFNPNTRVVGKAIDSNESNFEFGLKEWQQKYNSNCMDSYTQKDLHNNCAVINQPYLQPNYSGFEYVHFPNKEPFLTSNKRDFKPITMTDKDRATLDVETKNFIRNSKIILGTTPGNKNTLYQALMIDPKQQHSRFNYDKIHFKYNPYHLDPITQKPIYKDPNFQWGFECYNEEKNKKYVANQNMSHINTDYKKVWDPITNRYFYGTLKCSTQHSY